MLEGATTRVTQGMSAYHARHGGSFFGRGNKEMKSDIIVLYHLDKSMITRIASSCDMNEHIKDLNAFHAFSFRNKIN